MQLWWCNILHIFNDGYLASLSLLLPFMAADLALSYTQAGLIKSVGIGAMSAAQIPAGLLAERGRSRQDIEISISPYMRQTGAREVEAFAEAGVDQLILYVLAGDRDELLGALDHVAVEVAELAHSL